MQPSPANSEDGFVKENKRIIKTNSLIPFFLATGTGVVWGRGEPIFPSAHRPKLIRVDTLREWMNARDSQEDHRETPCVGRRIFKRVCHGDWRPGTVPFSVENE